jgi:diacylglycerol kinase
METMSEFVQEKKLLVSGAVVGILLVSAVATMMLFSAKKTLRVVDTACSAQHENVKMAKDNIALGMIMSGLVALACLGLVLLAFMKKKGESSTFCM